MRILVVDDEELARQRLTALISELGPPYELTGQAANGEEALELFRQQGADLVLMDIRMPVMDGLEAARLLSESEQPPAVVFTTAYEEHALEAFESAAQDYLLKPVRRERLLAALQRSQRLTRSQMSAVTASADTPVPHLRASYRGGVKTLPLDEVIYLRAEAKYVVARHAEGELLLEESLKSLQEKYGGWLMRIHRNALVSKRFLTGLEKNHGAPRAVMKGCDETLEISRRHLPEVRRQLKG